MTIQSLSGKNICILGYGREGKAMVDALEKCAQDCKITITDKNNTVDIPKSYASQLGEAWLKNLDAFDVIITSPGIPPLPEIIAQKAKLTSPTQIFLDTVKEQESVVIGITGSKGKSTTSSLLFEILKAAGKDVFLVGNIGEPAIAHLKDAKKNTIFVHEMSSYQLMLLTSSPNIAVVTAFFPEHLDYHVSTPLSTSGSPLENYLEAKKQIARFQVPDDSIYYNARIDACKEIANQSAGRKHPFSEIDAPLAIEETKLKGTHNLSNIAAAFLVAEQLGVTDETAISVIRAFKGLSHRLESLGIHGGLQWVNDSISTTPESAIAALNALGDDVTTLIAGGQDRGYDFDILALRIASSKIQTVVLLPDSGFLIGKAIERAGAHVLLVPAETMEDAVREAVSHTEKGTVLLSPSSPSYGRFKNFEERGEQLKRCIACLLPATH